jgi:uncharacterized protein YvpB
MIQTRILLWAGVLLIIVLLGLAVLANPTMRNEVKLRLGLEPAPQITPLAVVLPAPRATSQPTRATTPPTPTSAALPTGMRVISPRARPSPTALPSSTPSPAPVIVGGRTYTAYIPAAVKERQLYQYTCEFDAAWVVLQTFGVDVTVDEIIARTPIDASIEPHFEQTSDGFVIYGGDIQHAFSGNYRENFLARSSGSALIPVFASFGLAASSVADRVAVEAALRRGALIWMKTTVDFKPWRPAVWITPDGARLPTVLGNDHAVVVIGFNDQVVVIRDVLGPTSTNWHRPQEYEVSWEIFLKSWSAQGFDGLAVEPPAS